MLKSVASEVVQEQVDTNQVCEECDATFKSKRKFNMHMNGDHILIMNILGNSSIKKIHKVWTFIKPGGSVLGKDFCT